MVGGVSSGRQRRRAARTGRPRSRRARNASTSSDDASAQCDVVDDEHAGPLAAVASSRTRATPSRKRACAPGPSSVGVGGVPSSGRSRAASAAGAAPTEPASPVASALRSELDRAAEREPGLALDAARGRRDAAPRRAPGRRALRRAASCRSPSRRRGRRAGRPARPPRTRRAARPSSRSRPTSGCVARRRSRCTGAVGSDRRAGRPSRTARYSGGRLLGRRDAELAMQGADALAVLRERRGPLAARAVELDQPPVRRSRCSGSSASRRRACSIARAWLPRAPSALGEPVEDAAELARERPRLERLPVVERSAVAEPEAGEERRRGAARAACSSSARSSPRREPAELVDVERARPPARARPRRVRPRASGRRAPSAASRASAAAPRGRGRARTPATGAPPACRGRAGPARPRDRRAARSPCACRP